MNLSIFSNAILNRKKSNIMKPYCFFVYDILGDKMIGKLIGNTPIIKIKYKYKEKISQIYAKLEFYNLTGSIKDRVAYYMIKNAKENGALKSAMPLVEATSGNTGISIAALGRYFHHPVNIFMPDWVSEERVKIMKLYGANVQLFSKEEGGFKRCIEEAKKFASIHNGFLTNQFSNEDNVLAHYETTGKEICNQLSDINGFISGIGTGGTLMGVGRSLKEKYPNIHIWALEPKTMSLIKTGNISSHKIEGIGDEFIPQLVDLDKIEEIILVDDEDAIQMARKLSSDLGLGVGISSGANFLGAIQLNEIVGGNIVTIFVDDSKKYLTTDLSKEKLIEEGTLSSQIELIDYEVL